MPKKWRPSPGRHSNNQFRRVGRGPLVLLSACTFNANPFATFPFTSTRIHKSPSLTRALSQMTCMHPIVRMTPAPACAVRAASCEIATELAAHVFIVAVAVAIVCAIHPYVTPAVALMPRHAMPACAKSMMTVPGIHAEVAHTSLNSDAVGFGRSGLSCR